MRSIRTLFALLVLLAAAGVVYVYSGLFDIAATQPDPAWRARIFEIVKDRAIDRQVAAHPITPPPLTDPRMLRTGLAHFAEMCVVCHGAPGVPKSEIGHGLNPDAPSLSKEGAEQSAERLFWVLKNGIKMSGMPAFGPTHSDTEIWAMVAFVKQLPSIDAQRYAAMVKEAEIAPRPAGGQPEQGRPPVAPSEHPPAPPPAAPSPNVPPAAVPPAPTSRVPAPPPR